MKENKPCSRQACLEYHKELIAWVNEDRPEGFGLSDGGGKLKFHKCPRCKLLVCGHHSTAAVLWRDKITGERRRVNYDPSICKKCSSLARAAGEYG